MDGPVVVAIPATDEEERLAACLEALDGQVAGRADHIVVLLNNCSDGSAVVAGSLRSRTTSKFHVMEVAPPVMRAMRVTWLARPSCASPFPMGSS